MAPEYSTGRLPLHAVQQPPYTIESPGAQPVPGETIPRRNPKARDGLLEQPLPGVDTMFALLQRSGVKHAGEPAVGSRKFLGIHKELKKVPKVVDGEVREVEKEWAFFELSGYTYQTYSEYLLLVQQVGAGLRRLGLVKQDKVHVFAATSPEWLAVAQGCSSQSLVIVTAYDTLGEVGVQHSLSQTGAVAMFVDPHLLKTATRPLESVSSLRYVIYNDASHQPVPPEQLDAFREAHPQLKLLSFEELRALGTDDNGQPALPPDPPQPEDTFCIMYTSGSTGVPKGVPVTHAGFVAAVAGLFSVIGDSVSPSDRVLAYLPLAHIFELVVESLVLLIGGTLGYGSPRTLTDASMKTGCLGDLRAFQPTILVGVPQVWETVRKGVVGGVDSAGFVAKSLFWGYVSVKGFLARSGLIVGPIESVVSRLDDIIFARVRNSTGGRLRFIVNGASAIAGTTLSFLSLVVAPMITGYGLTETCGNGALGSPLQWTPRSEGPLSGALEVKLVSRLDLGYDANPPAGSDRDAHGEILMRGKPVVQEYYKNPEETAEVITPDGWFRTGDIGAFDRKTGHLRVVDRVKNLVKMQGGEYIALEKLEAIYRGAAPAQNVMVYGDSEHPRPIAVVLVNEKIVEDIASKLNIDIPATDGHATLHNDARVRAQVLKELIGAGRAAGLNAMELVQGVVIADEEWTPANVSILPSFFFLLPFFAATGRLYH